LWHESELEIVLKDLFSSFEEDTEPMLFGDPAYKGAYGIMGAYVQKPGQQLTNAKLAFNRSMSSIRITIEQLFGRTLNLWARNGHKYSQKLRSSPVAAYYMIAVLLTNIKTCVDDRDNQVASYFGCKAPSLFDYLGSVSQKDGNVLEQDVV
jgi:nuclease HARBI1